jgi:hypothetical protein
VAYSRRWSVCAGGTGVYSHVGGFCSTAVWQDIRLALVQAEFTKPRERHRSGRDPNDEVRLPWAIYGRASPSGGRARGGRRVASR